LARSRVRSNCLIWALGQWKRHGGYLIMRRSHWGPFPHFLWSADLRELQAFEPVGPRRRLLPPIWFLGRVIKGAR
jgi:hypothetical protein